jgi:hypothetical protein
MVRARTKLWLPSNLLLVLLLVGAQNGALAHAFKHDLDVLQRQACPICVTVSQLDSSCVDAPVDSAIERCHSCQAIEHAANLPSRHALAARQRGPPNPL